MCEGDCFAVTSKLAARKDVKRYGNVLRHCEDFELVERDEATYEKQK